MGRGRTLACPLSFAMKTVVIPDIHHDLAWARSIMDKESNADEFVFQGDYFDPKGSDATYVEVCEFLRFLKEDERVVLQMGNHDYTYALFAQGVTFGQAREAILPSNLDHSAIQAVCQNCPPDFFDSFKLAHLTQGHCISHAGLGPDLYTSLLVQCGGVEGVVAHLNGLVPNLCRNIQHMAFWCSPTRGGHHRFSGVLWLDFGAEFANTLPVPQLVGHTASCGGFQTHDGSVCLDSRQTTYGLIKDGQLSIHTL